jgi:hypothetical protein
MECRHGKSKEYKNKNRLFGWEPWGGLMESLMGDGSD